METKKKASIRRKLTAMVVGVTVLAIVLLGAIAWWGLARMESSSDSITTHLGEEAASNSQTLLEEQAMNQLESLGNSIAETVDARIQAVTSQVEILGGTMADLYNDPDTYGRVPVYPVDAANTGKFVGQIVYAERTDPTDPAVIDEVGLLGNLTTVMARTSEILQGAGTTQLGTETGLVIMADENSDTKVDLDHLEPTGRAWYLAAVNAGELAWTEVFADIYGRGIAVSCGKPVYDANGDLRGVVSISSSLAEISEAVTDAEIGEHGYAFAINEDGMIIMGKYEDEGGRPGVEPATNLFETDDADLLTVVTDMAAGNTGMAQVMLGGEEVYLAYKPMESIPWTVVTVLSVDEVQSAGLEGKERIDTLSVAASEESAAIRTSTIVALVVGMAVIAILAVVVGASRARRISQPILQLEQGVKDISAGDLEAQLDIQTGDEIQQLAESFNAMTGDLRHYIADLTAVTAEKERIGAELNVATKIQASMLPCIFPAFPEHDEFDIYATMEPAKEVGGDFYDFFMVDDTHLCVVMADVSGKGVPAALFMVIAKTLMKTHAQNGDTPSQILTNVNDKLCENNDAGMFVTAWVGIYDLVTGTFTYANAGHNPPLVRQEGGDFVYLHSNPGFVLAGMEGMRYKEASITLKKGDQVYLYTDGITEATNATPELYGEDRLLTCVNGLKEAGLEDFLHGIKADVDAFVAEAPQFDDMTMLVLRIGKE